MTNKIYIFISTALLLAILISTVEIGEYNNVDNMPETRPNSVPAHALWVGGIDGGVYILITKNIDNEPRIYNAVIYHEIGSIEYKGRLIINSSNTPLFDYENASSYSMRDGDTLYLRDERYLKEIDIPQ